MSIHGPYRAQSSYERAWSKTYTSSVATRARTRDAKGLGGWRLTGLRIENAHIEKCAMHRNADSVASLCNDKHELQAQHQKLAAAMRSNTAN